MPLPGPAIYYYVSPAGSNPIHGFIKKTAKTPKKELERRKEMKEAIEQFYQHRTPRARAEMIERFRQRERKPQKEYTMGLVHPWD